MSKWTGWGLLLWFLFFPQAVKNGIANGLDLGGRVLVPAIFPYLVLSGILIKTGALRDVSNKIKIGKLSKNAREILLPSLVCGYPTGAKLASSAYDNGSITKQEFYLLFLFANVPGFGFCVSYLSNIVKSPLFGWLIYISFVLSTLTFLCLFAKRISPSHTIIKEERNQKKLTISEALVESVSESAQTMVSLLFFVCFFSSMIELSRTLPLPQSFYPIGASFLEITTGVCLLIEHYPVETVVFFCGFSGLSVLFQSLYFDKKHAINFLRLLLGRMLYGMLAVCYFIILRLLVQ